MRKIVCFILIVMILGTFCGCSNGVSTSGNYKKLNDNQKQIVDTLYSSRGGWEQSPPEGYKLPFQSVDLYKDNNGDLYFFIMTKDVSKVTGGAPTFAVYGTKMKCFKLDADKRGLSEANYEVSTYYSIADGFQSIETLNGKEFTYKYTNTASWSKSYSEAAGKDTIADLVLALGL